jgi:hypothetical protein
MQRCEVSERGTRALPRLGLGYLLLAVGLACTAGCSTTAAARRGADDALIAMGWVQAQGEVRIYPQKADLGSLYEGKCTSGVMTGSRLMPKKFSNHYVAVYGRLVDARELEEEILRGITSGVENYCNSPQIAIITRIESVPEK